MFDCPEQSQTPQKSTFFSVTLSSPPLIFTVCGPPAWTVPIFVCDLPSSSATAALPDCLPSTSTTMRAPGVLQPQIGAATSRCKIMSSVNSECTNGSGRGCVGHHGCGPFCCATAPLPNASISRQHASLCSIVFSCYFAPC